MPTSESQPKPNTLAGLSYTIFLECIENAIRDVAAESHRLHKIQQREALSARQLDALEPLPRENGDATSAPEICSHCRLPRLDTLSPSQRTNMDDKRFCNRVTFTSPDSLMNAVANDGAASKKSKKNEKDNGLGASFKAEENGSRSTTPKPKDETNNLNVFCTKCEAKIAATRYAAHLDRCLVRTARKPDGRT